MRTLTVGVQQADAVCVQVSHVQICDMSTVHAAKYIIVVSMTYLDDSSGPLIAIT
jgi:hypothetical protein